jgi:group I intron endonuclease
MFYLVYKITNTLNGKYYIGCHKTKDKNDGYMGSGKLIKRAIQKYGIDNFKKEIIIECSTAEEMYEQENKLVNIEEDSYNIKLGGLGGFDHINSDESFRIEKNKVARRITNEKHKDKLSEWGQKGGKANIAKNGLHPDFVAGGKTSFLGKHHTLDAKHKISLANTINQAGQRNSQYGTMWITNNIINKKINKTDSIPDGWRKGRVMNNAGKVFMDAR